MSNIILLCTWLLAVLWGAGHEGHAYEIVIRPNLQTLDCPNGNVYMKECKKCFCKENPNNSTHWPYPYCRKDLCDGWTCPDPNSFVRECEGQCTCDATTSITTCEKYCVPKMQGVDGVKKKHYDIEVELDGFV